MLGGIGKALHLPFGYRWKNEETTKKIPAKVRVKNFIRKKEQEAAMAEEAKRKKADEVRELAGLVEGARQRTGGYISRTNKVLNELPGAYRNLIQ